MSNATRTIIFAAVAAVSATLAAATHYFNRPVPLEGFELVGEEFYPEFTDPSEAKSLRVAAYNPDTASIKEFNVEFKDGRWRIPSHHYYPADAQDRLAKTAASVIGIQRGALVTRSAADHERLGVVDPLSENATELKGRGKRITLLGSGDVVLADLIIGDEVKDHEGQFNVRRPDEKAVYVTKVKIDLSTKFADWIESDLLKLQRDDLREIVINKYSVDESKYPVVDIVGKEVNTLTHGATLSDPWKLEGLDEAMQELKADEVRTLVGNLDNLKIVGVRPKPQGLKPDLSVDREIVTNQLVHQALLADLAGKGFLLAKSRDSGLQLISKEGELSASTSDGAVYDLRFGEIFTGDETEIEIGARDKADAAAPDAANKDKPQDAASGAQAKPADEGQAKTDAADGSQTDDKKKDDLSKSRYLFVSVRFDPQRIGPEPKKPEEPKAPDAAATPPAAGQPEAEKPADAAAANPAEEKAKEPSAEDAHKQALDTYQQDLAKYESDKKDYDKKVADGKKKVDELNDRFGSWYYVISSESFENLRLSRADLVKPKEQKEAPPAPGQPGAAAPTAGAALPATPAAPTPPAAEPAQPGSPPEEPSTQNEPKPPSETSAPPQGTNP